MAELDELFELRNLFWVGAYQAAINEGLTLTHLTAEHKRVERDTFVYRAYVARGEHALVLQEVKHTAAVPLQAVRCLASYLSGKDNREIALATIKEWLSDPQSARDETIKIVAGTIYYHEENYDEAIKALHDSNSLEGRALLLQAYLQISRVDLAQKELGVMQQMDDDSTVTQLATAWIDLFLGGDKYEEAFFIFNELCEKWNATPLLLNGMAVCNLSTIEKKDSAQNAERHLLEALEKNPNEVDTLINLITLYQHVPKSNDVVNRYSSQVKSRAPDHLWVKQMSLLEQSFERNAARFSATYDS
ncbi:Coatomer subunit epsilon, variant 2 [Balamuthia mandrillaris]